MYAVIRKYSFEAGSSQEISRKISDGFIPLIRQTPGFVSYHWIDNGEGTGSSVGIFQDKKGAEESVRVAADFVKANLSDLLGKPEITEGEVKASS
jgi:hypothetical protein